MSSIDNRIVEMQFENKQFENGIAQSTRSIDNLKKSLKLDGAAKGFENLDRVTKGFSLSSIASSVETVSSRFSTLGIIGVTALQNITNSAMTAGKHLVDSFTMAPVLSGFQEYETQINAVQTILANTESKGENLQTVNKALDELNQYADKTIYNFTEMTRNIGTFTAAGVDLDTSVAAIKGIANLAAVSGSNSNQASSAMYQLSQALASGTVKLQDWNSVVQAGMGGQIFQDALAETARVHGVAIDSMIEQDGKFQATLSRGWLTSDILTETLSKFTGDLTEAQLRTMGYNEEQIAGIIKMGETANDAATKVKTFSQLFSTLSENAQSGWTESWELIVGDFENAKELLTNVSNIFGDAIEKSSKARNQVLRDALYGAQEVSGRDLLIDSFANAYQALSKSLGTVKSAYRDIFPPLTGDRLYDIIEGFHNFTNQLIIGEETANDLKRTFRGAFAVLDIGKQAFFALAGGAKELVSMLLPAGSGLLKFTGNIGDFLVGVNESIKESKLFENGISKLIDGLRNAGSTIKNSFIGEERYSKITESLFKMVDNLGDSFRNAGKSAKEFLDSFIASSDLEKVISKLGEYKNEALDNFSDNIEKIANLDPSEVFQSFLDFLDKGKAGFSSFTKELKTENLPKIIEFISEKFEEFKKSGKNAFEAGGEFIGKLAKTAGSGLMEFAQKIGVFVKGLLPGVDGIKNLARELAYLTTMFYGLKLLRNTSNVVGSFSDLLDSISSKIAPDKQSKIRDFAESVAILSGSLAILSLVPSEKLKTAAIAIGALIAGMAGIELLFGFLSKKEKIGDVSGSMNSMISLSASLLIIAGALNLIDMDGIWGKVAVLGTIAVGLGVIAGLMGKFVPQLTSGSLFLLAFSFAVGNIIKTLSEIGEIDIDASKESLVALFSLMVGLGSLAALTSKMKFGSAAGLYLLIFSIRSLLKVLEEIGDFDTNLIKDNIAAYVVVFGSLIGLSKLIGKASGLSAQNGIGLLGMAVSLMVIVDAIKEIGQLNSKVITRGTIAVSALMIFMGVFSKLAGSSGANGVKLGASLIAMSLSIYTLTRAVSYIGKLDAKTILKGVGAVGVLSLMLGGLMRLSKFSVGSFASIIGITLGIATLTIALHSLTKIKPKKLEEVTKSLTAVMLSFSVMTAASGLSKGAGKSILAMTVALVGIATVLGLLTKFADTGNIVQVAQSLSLVLLALTGATSVLSFVPAQAAGSVALGLIAVTAAITAIIAALGGLKQIPGFDWLMGEGTAVLGQIGNAIGTFSGSIVGGFAAGATSTLPEVGENLSKFMAKASLFFFGVSHIKESSVAGVAMLADAVLTLTKANFLDGITKFVSGSSTFDQFAEQLPKLGDGLKAYATSVSDIPTDGLESAITAAKALAELANAMPRTNGMLQMFIGDNTSLSSFGSQLKTLGEGLYDYADSVSGIPTDGIESAITTARGLSDLANTLPNEGGVLGYWLGENGVGSFGSQLKTLGEGLYDYADSVSGLPEDGLEPSIDAANALSELADTLPNTGGLVEFFSGDNNIADFGEDLADFGESLTGYYTSVSTIDTGQLSSVATELGKFVEIVNKLSELDMTGAYSFQGALGALGSSGIDQFIAAFSEATPQSESAGTEFAEALTEAIQTVIDSYAPQLATSGQTMMQEFITALVTEIQNGSTALNIAMQTVAEGMIRAGVTALLSGAGSFRSAGMTLGNAAAGGIGSLYQRFYTAGSNAARGFINGIISGRSGAIKAAASVASAALTAANTALRIGSPSKEFERTGMYADQGFANGFLKYAGVVKHASESVGKETLNTVHGLLLKLNDVVTSDLDMTPTIRPVIDFSDITRGTGVMNNLLSSGTYGVNANLYGIGQNIDRRTIMRNQKAMENSYSDAEVIRAINRLGEQLFTLKDAIAGMQVVMNSGALVGSIGGKMDARLGQIAGYKERGI